MQKEKTELNCRVWSFCNKIGGANSEVKMPPTLNKNSLLAWEIYFKQLILSGSDGMSGMPKTDRLKEVIDSCNLTISEENYELMYNKIIFIHAHLSKLRAEEIENDVPETETDN